MLTKYKRGGPGGSVSGIDIGYTIHYAILVCFVSWCLACLSTDPVVVNTQRQYTYDHKAENDPEELVEDNDSEGSAAAAAQRSNKKRKVDGWSGGRVKHGECFWSKFDLWSDEHITRWGLSLTTTEWKRCVHLSDIPASCADNNSMLAGLGHIFSAISRRRFGWTSFVSPQLRRTRRMKNRRPLCHSQFRRRHWIRGWEVSDVGFGGDSPEVRGSPS
jgi:hypothetical protein